MSLGRDAKPIVIDVNEPQFSVESSNARSCLDQTLPHSAGAYRTSSSQSITITGMRRTTMRRSASTQDGPFGTTRPSAAVSSVARQQFQHSKPRLACRAEPAEQGQSAGGVPALNEDMLAQLRAAQEEAARLKKELSDMQENRVGLVCRH